jgi:recombinational DNA repair ATPase RecF
MAKALLGYATGTDPRVTHRLSSENRVLRQRVADLEAAVQRLQQANDALAALEADLVKVPAQVAPADEVLEPA